MSTSKKAAPANPISNPALLYTIEEAAAALRMSRATLYRRITDGSVKSKKLGSRRFISHGDLESWGGAS